MHSLRLAISTGLRSAASRALSDQRLYSPAGDNAIEHYLALRAITTGDDAVETALLELLPYAQTLAAVQAPASPAPANRPAAPAVAAPLPVQAATQTRAAVREPVPVPVPDLLEAPQPRYPLMALRRKLEGEVVLELRIEANGSVGQARVISASPPGLFDDAAVAAVERWRFAAGQAAVTTRQVMRFRLPAEGRSP